MAPQLDMEPNVLAHIVLLTLCLLHDFYVANPIPSLLQCYLTVLDHHVASWSMTSIEGGLFFQVHHRFDGKSQHESATSKPYVADTQSNSPQSSPHLRIHTKTTLLSLPETAFWIRH